MTAGPKAISGMVWFAATPASGRATLPREVTLLVPDLAVSATITDGVAPDTLARVMSAHPATVSATDFDEAAKAHTGGRVSIILTEPGTHVCVAPLGGVPDPTRVDRASCERAEHYEILGVVVRNRPGTPSAATPAGNKPAERLLRRSGDFWTITDGARALHIKDSKGLRCLARLLSAPHSEVHVLELVSWLAAGVQPGPDPSPDPRSPALLRCDAGPILDHRAKVAYRARLQDLEHAIEEATSFGDAARAARAEAEKDALLQQLASALGLGGRDRKMASTSERARVNVTRTIRAAIDNVASANTALGSHLRESIHTGVFCCYRPPASASTPWLVEA